MSLLTICQGAADEIGIIRPTSIFGNTDDGAVKLKRYAQKVGHRLMTAFPWQILTKEQTFTSVATEEQTSILPADFDRFVPETFWNRTDSIMISGPVVPLEWQGLKAGEYTDTNLPRFRLRGDAILVIPTLTAGKTLAFEYISNQWCQDSVGSGQSAWADDTDTGVIDEELMTLGVVYEFLAGDGLPTAVSAASYSERFTMLVENDQPGAGVLIAADIFSTASRHHGDAPPTRGSLNVI